MKLRTLCYLTCSAMLLGLLIAVGIAQSFGLGAPSPCLKSRSLLPLAGPSVTPMLPTDAPRTTSTNSTVREGLASWYDRESCIRESGQAIMSNLQPLDNDAMTCALWITGKNGEPLKPDSKLVSVRNVKTGATVTVAWTDNGPGSVPRSQGVICDLTPRAMRALAGEDGIRAGRVEVTMEEL